MIKEDKVVMATRQKTVATSTKTSGALVGQRTIPTERPPLVGEVSANLADRGCRVVRATNPHGR
jgi:hypothetical protein